MNEFEAMINSLGEHTVGYIGRERLRSVTIWSDEATGTADVAIELADDSWDAQEYAIDKMLEVREIFMSDLAIDYRLFSGGSPRAERATAPALVLLEA